MMAERRRPLSAMGSRTTPRRLRWLDRKSTRLNSSHTEIYTLSLHDALPIWKLVGPVAEAEGDDGGEEEAFIGDGIEDDAEAAALVRSEEHTSELQSHRDLHSFPTRRSSDLETRRSSC